MKKITTILFSILIGLISWESAEGQTTIAEQDFDSNTSWGYTTSISFFDDGWGTAYFGIIDIGSASPLDKAEFSSNILGENDLASPNGSSGFVDITFDEIDISSYSNVEITFQYQVIGYNANDDDARYEVFHDGVGQGQIDLHDGATDPDDSEASIIVPIPASVNDVNLVVSIRNNGQDGYSGFDNFLIAESAIKPEPTDHVTNFVATSSSISQVDIYWDDATSGTAPDNYLILINETGSFTSPLDENPQANDSDLSDGNGALNVSQGAQSASFTDLEPNTVYYFEIFPYTNSGSNVDYKIDGSVPSDNVSTLEQPDLVINEILADPPGSASGDLEGDTNGDGTRSSDDDEFLEFVNNGSSDLDISGWTISDASSVRHTFSSDPATILGPKQAVVVFGGGDPSGNFGGSIVQTTGSLSLSNGGESITVKDGDGNTLIEVSYTGSSDQSETRSPDLTGEFTDHTSADPDNSAFSPGTQIGGFSFLPRIEITGNEGWRMLSSPTSNNYYDDLLGNIWTQGMTGANYSGGEPNVVTYDGADFNAVDNLESPMTPGEGFLVFVYEDDDFDPGSTDSFPKVLEMTGTENSGSFSPTLNSGSEIASLVGNPYLKPIDWDLLDKTDLSNTVYVYDDSYGTPIGDDEEASGVAGSYRTWNGSTGSLTDGRIAPFQGFWVINSSGSPNPSLTINESDQTVGGTFYKNSTSPVISIRLKAEMNQMFNEAFLSFNDHGLIGTDAFDGLELSPLDHGDYISFSTEVDGTQMDINNLPATLDQTVEIPLHVQAFEAVESGWSKKGGTISLSWPSLQNIPQTWNLSLIDTENGERINLREKDIYTFSTQGSSEKINTKVPFSPLSPSPVQKEKTIQNSRFTLSINPNAGSNLENDIPNQFSLEQNYPNPFNPTTNIKYKIAESSNVQLNVYNVMGQRIATLVNQTQTPGAYEVTWDASKMASGIYHYRLNVGGVVFNRQMTLIK